MMTTTTVTATGRDLVAVMMTQAGDRYVFGAEASPSDADPSAWDCSELIEWACSRLDLDPRMPDGSWYQARHCQRHGTLASVAVALRTPGALLFRFSSTPFEGGRPGTAHVAVSRGDGSTIEARSSRHGVGSFPAGGRGWTHAALVPGLDYAGPADAPRPPAPWAAAEWDAALAAGILSESSSPGQVVTDERLVEFLGRLGLLPGIEGVGGE